MHDTPTVAVQAVIPTGVQAHVTAVGLDAVTVHVAGPNTQPTLHWSSIETLEEWLNHLRTAVTIEKARRTDIRLSQREARRALHRAGAR